MWSMLTGSSFDCRRGDGENHEKLRGTRMAQKGLWGEIQEEKSKKVQGKKIETV